MAISFSLIQCSESGGTRQARHLALRMGGRVYPTGFYSCLKKYDDAVMTSLKDGGTMIDYDEEDPEIRARFETALQHAGIPARTDMVA